MRLGRRPDARRGVAGRSELAGARIGHHVAKIGHLEPGDLGADASERALWEIPFRAHRVQRTRVEGDEAVGND